MSDVLKTALPAFVLAFAAWLAVAREAHSVAAAAADEITVAAGGADAYSLPAPILTAAERQAFESGQSEFSARWVPYSLIGGHWGRGPQSNAESCVQCHAANGRGRAPDGSDEAPLSLVLRLSVPGTDPVGGPRPHPAYGEQLNTEGVLGTLVEEGEFRVEYAARRVRLADGEEVALRVPAIRITALWYGPLGDEAIVSPRIARPVFGTGLLEAVPEQRLQEIAAAQRKLGFDGRPNRVWDYARHGVALGRFGHKAAQPSLLQQTAKAFLLDIGVTSRLFPLQDCWPAQRRCTHVPSALGVEAQDLQIDAIVAYLRGLAVPARRNGDDPEVRRGEALFHSARCDVCHVARLETGSEAPTAALRGRVIHPYTDLLLHDMGEALADGGQEFLAGPRDWRTAPLWGLGLSAAVNGNANLLHDGRARTPLEAILWHGGEAQAARDAVVAMSRQERRALLAFLDSL